MDTGTIITLISSIVTALGILTGIVIHRGKVRKAKRDKRSALEQKRRDLISLAFENKVGIEALYHILKRRKEYHKSLASNKAEFARWYAGHARLEELNRLHRTFINGVVEGIEDENRIMDEPFMDNLKVELEKVKIFLSGEKQNMGDDEKMFGVKIAEKNKDKSPLK
jgi:hypothetical protein